MDKVTAHTLGLMSDRWAQKVSFSPSMLDLDTHNNCLVTRLLDEVVILVVDPHLPKGKMLLMSPAARIWRDYSYQGLECRTSTIWDLPEWQTSTVWEPPAFKITLT